ncbi:MAG: hypothetical protein JST80_11935 [Bdellovibrionales bacterium]|nr:hypothetical protein [Bdellovibrionales bacterium]
MKNLLLLLLIALPVRADDEVIDTTAVAIVKPTEFDPSKCDDIEKIAQELIERELAGVRWQGGASDCLDQSKFDLVNARKLIYGDSSLLDPKVLLAKGKEVKIDPLTKNGVTGIYTVKFHYIGKKNAGFVNITDAIRFTIYSKKAIKTEGCAMLIDEPETFVMREECHHD